MKQVNKNIFFPRRRINAARRLARIYFTRALPYLFGIGFVPNLPGIGFVRSAIPFARQFAERRIVEPLTLIYTRYGRNIQIVFFGVGAYSLQLVINWLQLTNNVLVPVMDRLAIRFDIDGPQLPF